MSEVKEAGNVVTSENLAEFTANKLGLAVEAPTEAAEAEPVVEQEVQSEPEQEVPAEEEAKAEEKPKKANPKLEKRFSELSKARDQARQEAQREREAREALEARLRALEQQAPAPIQDDSGKPKPEHFEDAFQYAEALAQYEARRIINEERAREQQAKIAEEQSKKLATWAERVSKAKEEFPDYDEMINSSDVTIHNVLQDAIIESEVGPKILYHLAENEEYAKKFASMPLPQALKELGKLESRYGDSKEEKPAAIRKSKAPPPISPIKATSGALDVPVNERGEFGGSYQQWKELRKAGKIR